MAGTELLHAPILLQTGARLQNRNFLLAPDFAWNQWMAAIYVAGSAVTISNVEIHGSSAWQERWNAYTEPEGGPPGIPSGLAGIRAQGAPWLRVEGLVVDGLPREGLTGFGLADASITDCTITHTFLGLVFTQYQDNPRVQVSRIHVANTWGPGPNQWPGVGGAPSVQRPGGFIGSDGLAGLKLIDATISDFECLGEQFGSIKVVGPQRTTLRRIRGVTCMVQGTADLDWNIDKEPSQDCVLEDSLFDKSLGAGDLVNEGNGLQVSWNLRSLRVRNCTFRAAGHNGHGTQVAGPSCFPTFKGCTFDGWNGKRGTEDAYACSVEPGGAVNGDFAAVNQFVNQQRVLQVKP